MDWLGIVQYSNKKVQVETVDCRTRNSGRLEIPRSCLFNTPIWTHSIRKWREEAIFFRDNSNSREIRSMNVSNLGIPASDLFSVFRKHLESGNICLTYHNRHFLLRSMLERPCCNALCLLPYRTKISICFQDHPCWSWICNKHEWKGWGSDLWTHHFGRTILLEANRHQCF